MANIRWGYAINQWKNTEIDLVTKEQREKTGDARLSIAERYTGRQDYLDQVARAAGDLVRQRFMRGEDLPVVLVEAEKIWNAVH